MKKTFTVFCKKNINAIHKISRQYNKLKKRNHPNVLLSLAKEHTDEINQLYISKNKHYIVETGDLIILCLELLKESQADADVILDKCYKRCFRKLSELIKESRKQKGKKHGQRICS